tara:strand:+ start:6599 stop:8125 length:1527 start_codon:yes stop_codon:yes gene_type:complete
VSTDTPTVLVFDFGAQYAQLIARRIREANVYSEIVSHKLTAQQIQDIRPAGIILSGGPKSVRVEGAPIIDPDIYDLEIPILGICYGAQLIAKQLGGTVSQFDAGEYGRTNMVVAGGRLLEGQPEEQSVWMSHFDCVTRVPDNFTISASTDHAPVAAFESEGIFGVQYHPEVSHTPHGQHTLERWLDLSQIKRSWNMANVIEEQVANIKDQVGSGRAICGLSGGVDSAVAAALVHKAIGSQLTCVFVDTGLMRKDEGEQVVETFKRSQGIELIHVRAADEFFTKLEGVTEPEEKRKAIGELFIRLFEKASGGVKEAKFLVQGTLYPDIIESGSEHAATIKSHHNVGGLPDDMEFELVEPLRSLFKDEVRAVGKELGLPDEIIHRQPFPGPGLGVRIIGEVTPDKVATLQEADFIVRDELEKAGLDRQIWQSFAVLPDIRSVGVMGDERTYGYPCIIRAVTSEDAMTADWARIPYDVLEAMSSRIINEVAGINRVAYDITSKPPGTIEWE